MTEILDMSQFVEAKSDQLTADDLVGGPVTITVARVTGCDGDQPVAIHYSGDRGKPFKPCKTMRRVLMAVWGRFANEYVGRSLTVYRDDTVAFGALTVGGIRISHMSHIEQAKLVPVTKTKGKKVGIKIEPLRAQQQPAKTPTDKRGKAIAWIDWYADELAAATDQAALDAIHADAKPTADRITREFPDLYETRLSAMMPVAVYDFAIPTSPKPGSPAEAGSSNGTEEASAFVPEGPADDQRGEAFNDAEIDPYRPADAPERVAGGQG